MSDKTYTAKKNGSLFIQPDGPNTDVYYLGCYDLDEIEETKGDITLLQCFDENGNYVTRGYTESAPEPISVSLGTWIGKRAEYLEQVVCPAALYAQLRCDGRADLFDNWERGFALDLAKITGRTLTDLVRRNEEGDGAMISFSAQALPPIHDYFALQGNRVSVSELGALNNIVFFSDLSCPGGGCGTPTTKCQYGVITTDFLAGSAAATANVLWTTDGATFAAGSTDPFGAGESVVGAVAIAINRTTTRIIVGRGTADAGAPAEIAYTDDNGTTWPSVNVGSTNGQFFNDSGALFAVDKAKIFAVTTGGYIYESQDAGATWTARESGVIGTNAYNAIWFKDRFTGIAVGVSDQIAKTVDGGRTWSAATSPSSGGNLTTVNWNGLYWWVGTSNGRFYYSNNDATTWTRRTGFTGDGTGAMDSVRFLDKYIGYAAQTISGAGYVLYTRDGGRNWNRLTAQANSGLNDLYVCSNRQAWGVGEVNSSTGFVMKIQEA